MTFPVRSECLRLFQEKVTQVRGSLGTSLKGCRDEELSDMELLETILDFQQLLRFRVSLLQKI